MGFGAMQCGQSSAMGRSFQRGKGCDRLGFSSSEPPFLHLLLAAVKLRDADLEGLWQLPVASPHILIPTLCKPFLPQLVHSAALLKIPLSEPVIPHG